VLQLPVATQHVDHVEIRHVARAPDSRFALDRMSVRPASLLVPNQGAVMLWQTLRSAAIGLSMTLAESFRRLKTHKQHPELGAPLPADFGAETIEASFTVTPPKQSAPGKKTEVKAAV
jgi:hypothetical protein